MLQTIIKDQYKKQLQKIQNTPNFCFLLACADNLLFNNILDVIKQEYNNNDIKLVTLSLSKKRHTNRRLIYENLEKYNNNKINFLLLSSNITDIDNLEKRNKSRFNDDIIYFEPITYNNYVKYFYMKYTMKDEKHENISKNKKIKECNDNVQFEAETCKDITNLLEKEYAKDPTLESAQNIAFAKTNKINNVNLQDVYEMLTNTQLVILIISKSEKIYHTNVVTKFRKTVVKIPALKNIDDAFILSSYHSLIEFGLLDKQFKGNWSSFCSFVKTKTTYMKQILKKVKV